MSDAGVTLLPDVGSAGRRGATPERARPGPEGAQAVGRNRRFGPDGVGFVRGAGAVGQRLDFDMHPRRHHAGFRRRRTRRSRGERRGVRPVRACDTLAPGGGGFTSGSHRALSLRLLNVALIAVIVSLMADIGRRGPSYWPITTLTGRVAAVAWIATADVFLGVPMHPWSSVVAAAITMTSLTLVAMSLASLKDRGLIRSAKHLAIGAGATIALVAVHSRANVGIAVGVRVPRGGDLRGDPRQPRRPPPRDQRCAVSPSVCSSSCRCFASKARSVNGGANRSLVRCGGAKRRVASRRTGASSRRSGSRSV